MQSELPRQIGSRETRGLREHAEQAQMHAQVDQVDGIESAPPFENARDLCICGDLIACFGHGLPPRTILVVGKVYWRESAIYEAFRLNICPS